MGSRWTPGREGSVSRLAKQLLGQSLVGEDRSPLGLQVQGGLSWAVRAWASSTPELDFSQGVLQTGWGGLGILRRHHAGWRRTQTLSESLVHVLSVWLCLLTQAPASSSVRG